jgi:hypothetical protein
MHQAFCVQVSVYFRKNLWIESAAFPTHLEYVDGVDKYIKLSPMEIMVVVLIGMNWWTPITIFCFHGIRLLGIISESS